MGIPPRLPITIQGVALVITLSCVLLCALRRRHYRRRHEKLRGGANVRQQIEIWRGCVARMQRCPALHDRWGRGFGKRTLAPLLRPSLQPKMVSTPPWATASPTPQRTAAMSHKVDIALDLTSQRSRHQELQRE